MDPLCSQSGKEPEPAEWEKKVAGDVASATFVFFLCRPRPLVPTRTVSTIAKTKKTGFISSPGRGGDGDGPGLERQQGVVGQPTADDED